MAWFRIEGDCTKGSAAQAILCLSSLHHELRHLSAEHQPCNAKQPQRSRSA